MVVCCRGEQDVEVKHKLNTIDSLQTRLKTSIDAVQTLNQQVHTQHPSLIHKVLLMLSTIVKCFIAVFFVLMLYRCKGLVVTKEDIT